MAQIKKGAYTSAAFTLQAAMPDTPSKSTARSRKGDRERIGPPAPLLATQSPPRNHLVKFAYLPRPSARLARFSTYGSLPFWPDEMAGVAVGKLLQIILMLRLGFPEGAGGRHFSHHFAGP